MIGDGNCFYRALAKFMFGNKNLWKEVRKLMIKLCDEEKFDDYLRH